ARDAREVAHRTDAGVEIEDLAQRDVEGADPATHRRRERALDRDAVAADRLERLFRQPVTRLLERLLPCQHLEPLHPALPARDLLDHRIEHAAGGAPDVGSGPVALNEWDHRPVGHHPTAVPEVDAVAHPGPTR